MAVTDLEREEGESDLSFRRRSMFETARTLLGGTKVHTCSECGAAVFPSGTDAHFGWHLKIDNIDQRANAQGHSHSH